MTAALYALAGALIGVIGSAVADMIREKRELRRRNQEELRSICSDFTAQLARVRRYLFRLQSDPQNEELWELVDSAFTEARAHNERLLITAELMATQEAARHAIHFVYWMIQVTRLQSGGYDECREEFGRWLEKLYVSVRRELGLKNPMDVYLQRLDHPPINVPISSQARDDLKEGD
jgi:hypothetical protein